MNQLPQSPAAIPTTAPRRLLIFSALLCILAAAAYAGLTLGYQPYLENQITLIDEELNALTAKIPADARERVAGFYSQLLNIQSALNAHMYPSRLYSFLERATHQEVFWNKLTFNAKTATLSLEGVASSYRALTEQLEGLSRSAEVARTNLDESQESDGRIRFKVGLLLNASFLKGRLAAQNP